MHGIAIITMFKEHFLLSELIANDNQLSKFTQTSQIINHGLAPIVSKLTPSTKLQKATLLEHAKYKNWLLKAQNLCGLLNQHKIKFIIFKGFAYSHTLYQQQPVRPYSDIDILVDEKDYKNIEKLLIHQGYKAVASRQGRFISYQNSFYDEKNIQTIFDIHWQISNRTEIHPYFQFEKIYNASKPIKTSHFSFQTLDPIHAFIYACFHYQAHRPEDRKHIWLYDLALLWKGFTVKEQENCLKLANHFHLYHLVGGTLKKMQFVFGNLINSKSLKGQPFILKNNYLQSRNTKGIDFYHRLKKLKGIKAKTLYLSEYVFQNTHYVQSRYRLKTRKWVYFFYPRMWLEDVLKLINKP